MTMVRAQGALVLESETVCFDRDFAIAMAREDCGEGPECRDCAWSGVYVLDDEGRCVSGSPIFWAGSLAAAPRSAACAARCAPAGQSPPRFSA